MNQLTRDFKIADDALLQYARVTKGFFVQDIAAFNDFDGEFNSQKVSDLEGWLEYVVTNSDTFVMSEMASYTKAVHAQMEKCRSYYQQLRYFIDKAFKKNPVVYREFHIPQYRQIRRSQLKLIRFMENIVTLVNKYRADFLAVGARANFLDTVIKEAQELKVVEKDQETFKITRLLLTAERIKRLNKIWEFVQSVNRVSAFVFVEDFAKRRPYLLPKPKRMSRRNTILVSPGSKSLVYHEPITSPITYEIRNEGSSALGFYLAPTLASAVPEILTWVQAGETIEFYADVLPDGEPAVLMVLNENPQHDGEFRINPKRS